MSDDGPYVFVRAPDLECAREALAFVAHADYDFFEDTDEAQRLARRAMDALRLAQRLEPKTRERGDMSDDEKQITMTYKELCGFAFEVAGAASVPFMQDHPHYVMPTERISEGVVPLLAERGIDLARISGYGTADDGE